MEVFDHFAVDDQLSDSERQKINQVLLNRVNGPFIEINNEEDDKAFWGDIDRKINQRLGYDLFKDA